MNQDPRRELVNTQLEKSFLGALIGNLGNDVKINGKTTQVTEAHFNNRRIGEAVDIAITRYRQGKRVDHILLTNELIKRGKVSRTSAWKEASENEISGLFAECAAVGNSFHLDDYFEQLDQLYKARGQYDKGSQLARDAMRGKVEGDVNLPDIRLADLHKTDLGNAERLVSNHGADIRFAYDRNSWLVWDSKHWKPDAIGEMNQLAQGTIRQLYEEASYTEDKNERQALAKWALGSESRSRIDNMISLSRSFVPVLQKELDTDPMLLNVKNGTLHLGTGELKPHDRTDMITKLIDIPYLPEAEAPNWLAFLEMVTGGDKDLEEFLQTAVGYSATGRTDEHCFFNLYGTGSNGKTTFTEAIRRLVGDYSRRTDIESLMLHWKRSSGPTPYVAGLSGARFVLGSEIPEGRKMNEPLIKDLTGGDSISARFLHSNPFTFVPTHKLWIFGNYKPKIAGTDLGIWRRIRIIPFMVTIPKDVQRPMDEVLAEFEIEEEGILAWIVEGANRWANERLPSPEIISKATEDYRGEQDILQQFLDERCEMHPDYKVSKDEFFRSMKSWANENNEGYLEHRTKRWLTQQLFNRGVEHDAGKRNYLGIRLNIPF